MSCYRVFGSVHDPDLYFSRHIVERIRKVDESVTLSFEGVLELDFQVELDNLKTHQPGDLHNYSFCHIVLRDDKVVGSLMDLVDIAIKEYGIEDAEIANTMLFQKEAIVQTSDALKSNGRPAVFLELFETSSTGREDEVFGKVVIELFDDICPRACANFQQLCTGEAGVVEGVTLNLQNCPLHRLVQDGWVQSGDIVDGSGKHSKSVFGDFIEDESFSVEFGERRGGMVGYSNAGPHSNGSQFFITLGPCDWMNCTKVGFGRLVQGYDTLKKINNAPTKNQRPTPRIYIGSCGLMK